MGYPNYPNNRLIVDGKDLTTVYGMVLADGYLLEPPSPKTYTVDIPGGNGVIDLTEAITGDVAYNNRKQEFTFYVIGVDDFEQVKTSVTNFMHGKTFNYTMTMDPDYTYRGRFTISETGHSSYSIGIVGSIKVSIDAEPFKFRKLQVSKVNAVGGKIVSLSSGRMRVRPKIETAGPIKVIHKNKLVRLPQGAWTINDIYFEEGPNEIYVCSYDIRNLTWGDLKRNGVTWGDLKKKRLFEWYKSNGDGTMISKTWADLKGSTWGSMVNVKWSDLYYQKENVETVDDIYISHEWGDL